MKTSQVRPPSRLAHGLMSRVLGAVGEQFSDLEVYGLSNIPREGGAILVCNHLSVFDAVALTAALDRSKRDVMVLAKAELFVNPILAKVLGRLGVIPVHRGTERAADALHSAVAALKNGQLVALFPEGTIPTDGVLMEFKTGAVRMALEAGVPIIPVAMVGTDNVVPASMARVKRTLWRRSLIHVPIRVSIGTPMAIAGSPDNQSQVKLATAQVRSRVESQLQTLGQGVEETHDFPWMKTLAIGLTSAAGLTVLARHLKKDK